MSRSEIIEKERAGYPIRVGACLAFSLLLGIAAFRFWPGPGQGEDDGIYDARASEMIQVEEILPTQQIRRRPPPPAPLTPVIVPDDVFLDEIEIELTDELLTADVGEEQGEEEEGDAQVTVVSGRPDSAPRAFRIVEPQIPRQAQRRGIKAEVHIEVVVDKRGMVESATIVDRILVSGRNNRKRERVDALGYGLEEAALAAAEGWRFRPAREGGQTVKSLTTITVNFGI